MQLHSFYGHTYQEIFWFYVSVHNIEAVQVLDSTSQVEQHTAGISLRVFVGGGNGIKEISPLEKEYVRCERELTHELMK